MRFVIDLNNFIGAMGIAAGCGIGWTAGCFVAQKVLALVR